MANSNPWELLLGGQVLARKSTRIAACNAGSREARGFRVRRSGLNLRVRHRRRGETWELRRGSWMRLDEGAAGTPGAAA